MAGHSQFKNIMHRKGAQDKKRAKVFTKIIRELTVAAKAGGEDADANPRLRTAIANAKAANMPKDTMDRAVKRGAGGEDDSNFTEMRYEGYGPGGVAVIVEALTDNKNRTAGEVRAAFTKFGGNMGETNSVSFQFNHQGVIRYASEGLDFDKVFEAALEAGAEDVQEEEGVHEILCPLEELHAVSGALAAQLGDPTSSGIEWRPTVLSEVDEDKGETLLKLIDMLEDNDDVQSVFTNADFSDALLEKLKGDD